MSARQRRLYQPKTATARWIWMPPCGVRRNWRPTADLKTAESWRAGGIRDHSGLTRLPDDGAQRRGRRAAPQGDAGDPHDAGGDRPLDDRAGAGRQNRRNGGPARRHSAVPPQRREGGPRSRGRRSARPRPPRTRWRRRPRRPCTAALSRRREPGVGRELRAGYPACGEGPAIGCVPICIPLPASLARCHSSHVRTGGGAPPPPVRRPTA